MTDNARARDAPESFGGLVEQQNAHVAVDQYDAIARLFERLHQDGRKVTGRRHAQFALLVWSAVWRMRGSSPAQFRLGHDSMNGASVWANATKVRARIGPCNRWCWRCWFCLPQVN